MYRRKKIHCISNSPDFEDSRDVQNGVGWNGGNNIEGVYEKVQ